MKSISKKSYNAYFTVELALLFPIIFSVIVLIIYTAFLVHDRAVLDSAAYEAALRGSAISYKGADIEGKVKNEAKDLLDKRLFVTKNIKIEVDITQKEIKVKCSGDFRIPSGIIWARELRNKGKHIEVTGVAERLNPGQVIRDTRMIKNIAGLGGGHGD
ncbi:MAG: pilus assembly protein [Lachnospiraceae bacterium]|nr:pilus assembly protein [Lachnospiraceae bacterium]